MAAAIPFIAVGATLITGVMAYQASRTQAAMQGQMAAMYRQQAADRIQLGTLELAQNQLEADAQELAQLEEDNRRRKAAYRQEQGAYAQAAGRGYMAIPMGSFGAMLEEGQDNLYRDLESSRIERGYKRAAYAVQAAGIATAATAEARSARYQSMAATAQAQTTRMQGYSGLLQTTTRAAQLWPSS